MVQYFNKNKLNNSLGVISLATLFINKTPPSSSSSSSCQRHKEEQEEEEEEQEEKEEKEEKEVWLAK
jgi:ribosomal protein L12E/L44/L45/RPP1/RPP2